MVDSGKWQGEVRTHEIEDGKGTTKSCHRIGMTGEQMVAGKELKDYQTGKDTDARQDPAQSRKTTPASNNTGQMRMPLASEWVATIAHPAESVSQPAAGARFSA